MSGTPDQAARIWRHETGRARPAAATAAALGALALLWGSAAAETIPAQTFVLHNSWDVVRTGGDAGAAGSVADQPARATSAIATATGRARAMAVSADAADGPAEPAKEVSRAILIRTASVAHRDRRDLDQAELALMSLGDLLLFTPTAGGPAVALDLFFPGATSARQDASVPLRGGAEDEMFLFLNPIGGTIERTLTRLGLTSASQAYLAQIAPHGLETLSEARCVAVLRPPPDGCEEPADADARSDGLLARLNIASIPLPPAILLLATALACLGAIAWRGRI